MKKKSKDKYEREIEAVVTSLIAKDGKILLIKSHKWKDAYLLPGGHIDAGETIFDAAKREAKEETGLNVKPLYCVSIEELINGKSFNRKAHFICFHILCKAFSNKVKIEERELSKFIWIEPKKALKLKNLNKEAAEKAINNYVKGIKVPFKSTKYKKWK